MSGHEDVDWTPCMFLFEILVDRIFFNEVRWIRKLIVRFYLPDLPVIQIEQDPPIELASCVVFGGGRSLLVPLRVPADAHIPYMMKVVVSAQVGMAEEILGATEIVLGDQLARLTSSRKRPASTQVNRCYSLLDGLRQVMGKLKLFIRLTFFGASLVNEMMGPKDIASPISISPSSRTTTSMIPTMSHPYGPYAYVNPYYPTVLPEAKGYSTQMSYPNEMWMANSMCPGSSTVTPYSPYSSYSPSFPNQMSPSPLFPTVNYYLPQYCTTGVLGGGGNQTNQSYAANYITQYAGASPMSITSRRKKKPQHEPTEKIVNGEWMRVYNTGASGSDSGLAEALMKATPRTKGYLPQESQHTLQALLTRKAHE